MNVLKIANIDCKRTNIKLNVLGFFSPIIIIITQNIISKFNYNDFEYNILIITIYNTSAKLFLCKVQKAKFVFVLVKACSCIVQLFSGVYNVLSTPRNAISQIFTPIFVSCFVSCNVIDKEFYNSDAFENSRYIVRFP